MNQPVPVSRPLYFLLLCSVCYGFFKLSASSAGSRSGVAAGEHLPRRNAASGSYPCGGNPTEGRSGSATCTVPPRAARGLQWVTSVNSKTRNLHPVVCFGRTYRLSRDQDRVALARRKGTFLAAKTPLSK